jgi:hypothetical protein
MQRPQPQKHAECQECLRVMPLLMPVSFIPGWPCVIWELLCLGCRLNVRMSKHGTKYGEPGDVWKYSARKTQRDAYDEWLPSE